MLNKESMQNATVYYRSRNGGAEELLEDTIIHNIHDLVPSKGPLWIGGSLKIGGGQPDLTVVNYDERVYDLGRHDLLDPLILSYLHGVRSASVATISRRINRSMAGLINRINALVETGIIQESSGQYALEKRWRDVLADVITIEAKVANWKKAVSQAARNRLFSSGSYVALPIDLASRIQDTEVFRTLGIGLIAVGGFDKIRVLLKSRSFNRKVWKYYYTIASHIADSITVQESKNAIYRPSRQSEDGFSSI